MEPANNDFEPFATSSRRFGRRLLTIGENRFRLLMVELQEERAVLLHAFLLVLGVAVSGLLAAIALTAAIVVLFWRDSPGAVLLILTGLYGVAAVTLYWRLIRLLRDWRMLSATLDQLREDHACLEKALA